MRSPGIRSRLDVESLFELPVAPLFAANDRIPGYASALPVNTGQGAIETALKAPRKWANKVKEAAPDRAEIIACKGKCHWRSIAIVVLLSEAQYRDGFGTYPH